MFAENWFKMCNFAPCINKQAKKKYILEVR